MNNSINGQTSIFNADLTNDELDDAQLEAISGGITCRDSKSMVVDALFTSGYYTGQGNDMLGAFYYGMAEGISGADCS